MNKISATQYSIEDLLYLMKRLRDPETGCPWDLKQTYQSIASHTLEEVYEVIDAIERDDLDHLSEELGDLLFQIIFYSQMGKEQGRFDFEQITTTITEKLLRRHPHVFPEGTLESIRDSGTGDVEDINQVWESLKKRERADKGEIKVLDDIPIALPALSRATKLQKRAASVGFDWPTTAGAMEKVKEEIAELEVEISLGNSTAIAEEFGDLLFSCVNLARHLEINPETAMRAANAKFKRRFDQVEVLAGGVELQQLSSSELELLWCKVKQSE
jgi:ATP diphosphatase